MMCGWMGKGLLNLPEPRAGELERKLQVKYHKLSADRINALRLFRNEAISSAKFSALRDRSQILVCVCVCVGWCVCGGGCVCGCGGGGDAKGGPENS